MLCCQVRILHPTLQSSHTDSFAYLVPGPTAHHAQDGLVFFGHQLLFVKCVKLVEVCLWSLSISICLSLIASWPTAGVHAGELVFRAAA